MSQHILYGFQVGSAFHEVCSKSVPKSMRADILPYACFPGKFFHDDEHHDAAHFTTPPVEEHHVFRFFFDVNLEVSDVFEVNF